MGELNDILQRLEASLGPLTGQPSELGGGITNRNFRVTLGSVDYVIRRPGKDTDLLGIDREAERLATEAAAVLGIAPAVAAALDDCLVTRFIACVPLPARELAERVQEIAQALRRFHESATILPTSFRVPDLLARYTAIVRKRGGAVPAAYMRTIAIAARIETALPPAGARPCHNDLLPGNLIRARDGGQILIVDWEYAGMGDPRFDLGNLSINNGFDEATDDRLLSAYYGTPPSDATRAALKLMRVMSDAREAAWGVVQGEVSELDFDFEGYGGEHFERLQATVEQPQFEHWLACAEGDARPHSGPST
ncbi:MAG TPA: choline/ethanolamine kinase family protein [Solirubrobacteraceae bacterium]|nr:choline/ethanolamine kinase family protein [Solirubrobacteraceae bacterium]